MTVKQAVGLAGLRAALGLVLVGGGAWAIVNWSLAQGLLTGWIYLYISRIFVWWIVGRVARLRGWRMIGWIVGGEAINIVFDLAVAFGLATGILPAIGAVAVIAAFILVLEWRGHRSELLAHFSSSPCCRVCQYSLTGNLSGICPECDTHFSSTRQGARHLVRNCARSGCYSCCDGRNGSVRACNEVNGELSQVQGGRGRKHRNQNKKTLKTKRFVSVALGRFGEVLTMFGPFRYDVGFGIEN